MLGSGRCKLVKIIVNQLKLFTEMLALKFSDYLKTEKNFASINYSIWAGVVG